MERSDLPLADYNAEAEDVVQPTFTTFTSSTIGRISGKLEECMPLASVWHVHIMNTMVFDIHSQSCTFLSEAVLLQAHVPCNDTKSTATAMIQKAQHSQAANSKASIQKLPWKC